MNIATDRILFCTCILINYIYMHAYEHSTLFHPTQCLICTLHGSETINIVWTLLQDNTASYSYMANMQLAHGTRCLLHAAMSLVLKSLTQNSLYQTAHKELLLKRRDGDKLSVHAVTPGPCFSPCHGAVTGSLLHKVARSSIHLPSVVQWGATSSWKRKENQLR